MPYIIIADCCTARHPKIPAVGDNGETLRAGDIKRGHTGVTLRKEEATNSAKVGHIYIYP